MYTNLNHELFLACGTLQERAKELHIFNKKAIPLLRGRDILACGVAESKEFSTILKNSYEAQMDGLFTSHEGAKNWLKNYLAV